MADIKKLPIMFLQARGFKYIFDSMNQKYIDAFMGENPLGATSIDFMPVTATNGSFACELYLKAIFVYEHRNDNAELSKLHDLYSLFKKLSKNKQTEIINVFKEKYYYSEKLFINELEEISNNFIEYRYLFEQTSSYTLHLNFFTIFLRELDILLNDILKTCKIPEDTEYLPNTTEITKEVD